MRYLHENGIIHKRLNLSNVLLDENFHPLISDINSDIFHNEDNSVENISMLEQFKYFTYISPEYFMREVFNEKCDVYSFAIIMYSVITDSFAYEDLISNKSSIFSFLNSVMHGIRPKLTSKISEPFRGLLERCWEKNSTQRPSFQEIYEKLTKDDSYLLDDVDID